MKATIDDLKRELWLRKRGHIFWETKEGRRIPIQEMSLTHLINAINYFEKVDEVREIVLENSDILDK